MKQDEQRRATNTILRERIDRLRELHLQLHSLTNEAFEELLEQVRVDTPRDTHAVLDETIKRYVERLRRQQLRIEQEFTNLTKGPLLSADELDALMSPLAEYEGVRSQPNEPS